MKFPRCIESFTLQQYVTVELADSVLVVTIH